MSALKDRILGELRERSVDNAPDPLKDMTIEIDIPDEDQVFRLGKSPGAVELEALARTAPGDRMSRAPKGPVVDVAVARLFKLVADLAEGGDALPERDEAAFVPGSAVGRITVQLRGEAVELFFYADPEQRKTAAASLPPATARLIAEIDALRSDTGSKRMMPADAERE